MKRILALVLALLLIFALAACSDSSDEGKDENEGNAKNYYVTYNGQKIEIGADAKALIPTLGEYTSEDGEACGTDEKDVIYTLSGISIETHVSGDKETVRQVKFLDDSNKTPEGITIGSSRDDVVKAYGNGYTENASGALRYEGESTALEVYFGASGGVSNIYIKRK